MGQLMLRCPMTDRNFSTGIDTDRKSLKRIPYARIAVRCPYCGAPRRPFGAKRPTGQADCAADAVNIGRELAMRRRGPARRAGSPVAALTSGFSDPCSRLV
jgi:hypothetical protein